MARYSEKTVKSSTYEDNIIPGGKTYYIEESVKVIGGIIARADPILSELASKVKEFEKISKGSAKEREYSMIEKYGADQYHE